MLGRQMSRSQGHFELSSCFGSVSLFSYKKIYEIYIDRNIRFESCVLGGMQNNTYLFSQKLNTIKVDPQLCSRHAQGHATLALKTMGLTCSFVQ